MKIGNSEFIFDPNQYPLEPGTRLIEASAGTGKTFSLAHLVLRLITEKDISISEMLIISFTKATSSEIQSKISERIVLALKGLDQIKHEQQKELADQVLQEWIKLIMHNDSNKVRFATLLLKALEEIDYADITTIHGFCSKTLRREAIELGSHMNPVLLTEAENKQLIKEIAHEYWKEQMMELPEHQLKGLQAAGLSFENLVSTVLNIENDSSVKFHIEREKINDKQPLSGQFSKWVNDFWESFIINWEKEGFELEEALKNKALIWKEMGISNTKPFSAKPKRDRFKEINDWVQNFRRRDNRNNPIRTVPSYDVIRNNVLLKDYFHPSKVSHIEDINDLEITSLLQPKLQQSIAEVFDSPAELAWQHAITYSLKELKKRKSKVGQVSYSDQVKALDPENTELSNEASKILFKRLRERYKVVIVDEFQDTDPVQWRILNETFAKSRKHFVLMIGDPKQSIYRFRGGDLQTYITAKNQVTRIDSLRTNYRSTPKLVNSLNILMKPGLKNSGLEAPCLISVSKKETDLVPKEEAPIEIINFKVKPNHNKSSKRELPSQSQVEASIPSLVTNSIIQLLQAKDSKVKPDDICVLVNRHDQAEKIRNNLVKSNIPSRLLSQGDVLQSQASHVLQVFLDCLANPTDSSKIKLLACSPLLQWNIDKIKNCSQNGELDKLVVKCFELSEKLELIGLASCLSELLESKNLAILSEQGRLLGDIQQCTEIVQEAIHLQGLSSQGCAKWLRKQRQLVIEPTPETRRPNSDITEDAINIITIHSSKGLQYKIVICPYLWQSPPKPKGPLWKFKESKSWHISLSTGWGITRKFIKGSEKEAIEESERLAYVALTRAQQKLIVIWSHAERQQNNPLRHLLFGNKIRGESQDNFTNEKIAAWLNNEHHNFNIHEIEAPLDIKSSWIPPQIKIPLRLGPVPKRKLDKSWGRYSYSNWISTTRQQSDLYQNPKFLEEGKDTDQDNLTQDTLPNNINQLEPLLNQYSNSPLANFPRGPIAGDCLHRILEKISFETSLTDLNSENIIKSELSRSGIDLKFVNKIQEGLDRVLSVPLGGVLGNMQLKQLTKNRRINELQFDLSLARYGNPIESIDLFNVFLNNPDNRFGKKYPKLLKELDISSKGILTGSIDLVFTDKENPSDGRWWVADWKSNWIGNLSENEDQSECGPIHYSDKSMENQMIIHHYPLQAHLYLVALHRYLNWRLQAYNPSKHLGGYIYIFVRGIPSQKELEAHKSNQRVPGLIIEEAPLERILELDKLINRRA